MTKCVAEIPDILASVNHIHLQFGHRTILEDVSLDIHRGEFLGVIGPNGGGKTSLLRILLGVQRPTSGHVHWAAINGSLIKPACVPQLVYIDASCPFSAMDVVTQGASGMLPLFGTRRKNVIMKARQLLNTVGLTDQASIQYVHLSGGQQRRTLLARALMNDPVALLLDEPTTGVDTQGQEQFCGLLQQLSQRGVTVMLVSHDIPLVTAYANRIACLSKTLFWHGDAHLLSEETVRHAYGCELDRYHVAQQKSHAAK
jgi:zinc transport system ATP-binding protein